MSETLLRTKLLVPPLRSNLIPRPRLIERLTRGLQFGHKLTLISAPAGFGKTTLISEWVRALGAAAPPTPIAWLSLDDRDDDPERFLSYFIAALDRVEGLETAIGKGALNMLQSPRPPPAEPVLTSLINDITAIPDRIVLVLDDYQLIESSAVDASTSVDDALTFLLEHLPPQLHLVIVTRVDPNLPLARHRARGQLTELRAADLRFSSLEAAEYLSRVMGLDLSSDDVTMLESRTEGWIAGLQLAAISMRGRDDATGFIESFTGSHHFVMDYLLEDVLQQQPESVQRFLLQTAILDRLNGSLCDAVVGGLEIRDRGAEGDAQAADNLPGRRQSAPIPNLQGQETLEYLEQANLFIVPLDEERRWYRYHHLFSELLRRRLRQLQPNWVPSLHQRASEWYEQNGFADEAIEHAVRVEDFGRAADLIEEHIDDLWGRGENRRVQGWLDGLPEEILFSRPYISIFQARYQCNSGQLDAAERTLSAVEQALYSSTGRTPETEPQRQNSFTHSDRVKLRGRMAATRALISSYQGDVPGIIQHARQALEYLPWEDLAWRRATALVLGNAHGFKGDMRAAYEARFEALNACEAAGDVYFIIIANLELAITLREQGRLQRTIEICQQQLQAANESGLSQTRTVGWLLAIWGETLAELNDLDGALERAKKGFALIQPSGDLQMLGWSFMCLIRALVSRGDLADAEGTMQKMENIAREFHLPPWITDQMAGWQARLWLARDDLEAASQWMEDSGLYNGRQPTPPHEIGFFLLLDYLVVSRILIAQGRLEDATRLLQHLLKAAEAGGRTSSMLQIMILQALTFQAGGETDRALSPLEQALTLAEPEGFIRIFVDEGPAMARLLHKLLSRSTSPDYVRRLLAAFSADEPIQTDTTASQAEQFELVEPLSKRELEVLQLIAEGLTNREIADRLYLSLNTVKAHTRNIYGKLGVHSRTQAVARVQGLGLLPPSSL